MPSHYPVPTHEAIRSILAAIVGGGREVTVAPSADIADTEAPGVRADYRVDDGPVGVLCVVDLSLSNVVGAAIAAETSEAVDAAVSENKIADSTIENWNEVVNQIARLFNSPDTPTLRVREVRRLPAELPNDVSELLATPLARRAFDVQVADLGKGTLAVLVG